ncbi:hypothetical protein [Lysinibacillus sp. NPDC056232]
MCESVVQRSDSHNNGLRVQSIGAGLTWVMSTVLIRKYYLLK